MGPLTLPTCIELFSTLWQEKNIFKAIFPVYPVWEIAYYIRITYYPAKPMQKPVFLTKSKPICCQSIHPDNLGISRTLKWTPRPPKCSSKGLWPANWFNKRARLMKMTVLVQSEWHSGTALSPPVYKGYFLVPFGFLWVHLAVNQSRLKEQTLLNGVTGEAFRKKGFGDVSLRDLWVSVMDFFFKGPILVLFGIYICFYVYV